MNPKIIWILPLLLLLSACEDKNDNLLINPSFEEPLLTGLDAKWRNVVHAGEQAYEFSIDTTLASEGNKSYRIHQFKPQGFGLVNQTIMLKPTEKKTFEYSAMLRTQGIKNNGGLVLVINVLAADDFIIKQYKSEKLVGDTEWKKVTIKGEIHQAANRLSAGVMLHSKGNAWIDDVRLTVK